MAAYAIMIIVRTARSFLPSVVDISGFPLDDIGVGFGFCFFLLIRPPNRRSTDNTSP